MTTEDYLTQLQQDREDLIDNLESKGITGLTGDETFTELVPEVLNIPSGGGKYAPAFVKFSEYDGTDLSYEVNNLDTSNIENMDNMFSYCINLTSLDLSGFDTSNVKFMDNMITSCPALQSVDVSSFDTSSLLTAPSMFSFCDNLTTITFGNNFTFENLTGCMDMFADCPSLDDNTLNAILHLCTTVGQDFTDTKTLATLGITDRQVYPTSRIMALSNYQDFVNAGWSIS